MLCSHNFTFTPNLSRSRDRAIGVRIPVGSRILSSSRRADRLWSYTMGTGGSFLCSKEAGGVKLATHLKLVQRLRKCGSIYPLPHTSSWRDRDKFTFSLTYNVHHSKLRLLSCEYYEACGGTSAGFGDVSCSYGCEMPRGVNQINSTIFRH
jgi:hypothetical protein